MPASRPDGLPSKETAYRSLTVQIDEESRAVLSQAAKRRGVSMDDYVRMVTVAQARREVLDDRHQTLIMTPEEQLSFWKALESPVNLTDAQRRLATMMRGDS